MKQFQRIVLKATIVSLLLGFLPQNAYSGDLGALVQIDNQQISSTTGGTICATAETTDSENSLQVIFPSSMTVNSSASNWTVSTSNLPPSSTPMPGISTATSVSGQTVTFPISNLTVGTFYCFRFASSNTLTTPSSTGTYVGTLRTRDGSNSVIDTREYAIPVLANNTITVTATAPADPNDFSANLSVSPTDSRIRENTILTYELNYGSNLSYAHGITVEAEWEPGTIRDSGSPGTEDVLSYVDGSASNAYNNTPPVIDFINNKITWTISSFPANGTGTVSFQLRTYDDYKGSQPVDFSVNGRVLGPGTQTPDSTVTTAYQYSSFITPTLTPTCVPSRCPTPVPSSTPTPTPVPDLTVISDISVGSISDGDAKVVLELNNPSTVSVFYGTSINSLSQTIKSLNFSKLHTLNFEDLEPQKRYYFRLTITDQYGRRITSDIYQFDTAAPSDSKPEILIDSLIITSSDIILTDPLRQSGKSVNIVLPQNTTYSFKFAVKGYENVKLIKSVLRDSKVLGLSSNKSYASTEALSITEIAPGQYIGKLATGFSSGTHYLAFQLSDFLGNINEYIVSTVNIVGPLRAINATTKEGIENAKATLYFYNLRLKKFELISSAVTPIGNPLKSEVDGSFNVVLPDGRYKAEIEALGYKPKTVEFEISYKSRNYPTVELEPQPFDAVTFAGYFAATTTDVVNLLAEFIHQLRTSYRFFDLTAFIVFCIMSCLLLISASRRTSVPIRHLPYFLGYHFRRLLKKQVHNYLVHGKVVVEGAENVIADAVVYVMQPNGRVLSRVLTNVDGEFFAKITSDTAVTLLVNKKGYKTQKIKISKNELNDVITVGLLRRKLPQKWSITSIFWYISFLTGSLFETILIITILLELLFVLEFGFAKVAPFMAISLFNLLLWAFHVRHTKSA